MATNLAAKAITLLENLSESLEQQIDDLADVDLNGAMLSISLGENCQIQGEFLLNFHGPTEQLWLSSPKSGAHHFACRDGKWASTKSPDELTQLLAIELSEATGLNIDIDEYA